MGDSTYLWLVSSHFLGLKSLFLCFCWNTALPKAVGIHGALGKLDVLPLKDLTQTEPGVVSALLSAAQHQAWGRRSGLPRGGPGIVGCHRMEGGDGLRPATCPCTPRWLPPCDTWSPQSFIFDTLDSWATERATGRYRLLSMSVYFIVGPWVFLRIWWK